MALKPAPERKINQLINKGGSVTEKEGWTLISVRIPQKLLKEVDQETKTRIGLSRNAWILEAFQEKLKK